MQREIPIPGGIKSPGYAPEALIKTCRHRLDAIVLCVQLSKLSHERIAEELNLDKGHFSRILSGKAYFPDTKTVKLMELCGNLAPVQYEMHAMGIYVDEQPKRRASDFGGRRAA